MKKFLAIAVVSLSLTLGVAGTGYAQVDGAPVVSDAGVAAAPVASPAAAPVAAPVVAVEPSSPSTPAEAISTFQQLKQVFQEGNWLVLFSMIIMLGFGIMNKVSWMPTIPSKWMAEVNALCGFLVVFSGMVLGGAAVTDALMKGVSAGIGVGWGASGAYSTVKKYIPWLAHPGTAPAAPKA